MGKAVIYIFGVIWIGFWVYAGFTQYFYPERMPGKTGIASIDNPRIQKRKRTGFMLLIMLGIGLASAITRILFFGGF